MVSTVNILDGELQRILGRYEGGAPGPLFVCLGGVHGNEPGGVLAARRVLAVLERERPAMRGALVALVGNIKALGARKRYLRQDLNRVWKKADVEALLARPASGDGPEEAEQRDLLRVFEELPASEHERVVVLDLHSSSGAGSPFSCMADTLQNRRIALALPVPVILGLEESIEGSVLEYVGERGHVAVAVEGGQHDDPATVDHHEAAIWIALVAAGCLAEEDVPDLEGKRRRLARAARGLPAVVDIQYRHGLHDGDAFEMEPDYHNFQPVRRGEVLAKHRDEAVRAPLTGRMLLPRYQGQGSDGFFLVRDVRPLWLSLSSGLRRLGLERILSWLPGVRRSGERRDALEVNLNVARFLATDIFHLFGFRRAKRRGDQLIFERRREGKPWSGAA